MHQTMIRTVNNRERWYRLEVVPNLFGEWLLVRSFGSMYNPQPIGTMVESFKDHPTALESFEQLTGEKEKKGYITLKRREG